jgi:SAM-dependent methyltransferase
MKSRERFGNPERKIERAKFWQLVADRPVKIQVGARGKKIGRDWIAIDKFDTSDFIDHNYDLHDLPYEDCTVDCYMCNAVLEHIFEPQLAIFEMYRTLKVGGLVWVEVPFNQFYHAHPFDFRRWTVNGLKWDMRRFEPYGYGVAVHIPYEVRHIAGVIQRESAMQAPTAKALGRLEEMLKEYMETTQLLRLYSSTFFWGRKTSHEVDVCEAGFMDRLRREVLDAKPPA